MAYERSVLHRDVSCGNMMFFDAQGKTLDGGRPPKGFLLDFDHSVFISETTTNPKEVIDKALNEVTVRETFSLMIVC
jgi:hypothetical protein